MSEDSGAAPLQHVGVAIDFSENSERAAEASARLAREHGARLSLLHAFTLHPYAAGGPLPPPLPLSFEEEVREAATRRLDLLAKRLGEGGLEVTGEIEAGRPGPTLAELARRRQLDLLVTGTRGLTGLAHVLLGSTAQEVVRHAPCPVLCVPAEGSCNLAEPGTVLLATDFSPDAAHAADAMARLHGRRAEQMRVVLLHVFHLPRSVEPLLGDALAVPHDFAEIAGPIAEELEPAAARLRAAGFTTESLVREGDPSEVIREVAGEIGAELVVVGTRGHTGVAHVLLGSRAERVLQRSSCPVLVARSE